MSYRIAGIDVHKKMLAVVVSNVEVESEFQFERRMFGGNPEQLRLLGAWLLEQEAEEVVMESTAQYWKPVWGALERYWKPIREKREGAKRRSGTLHLAQAQSNRGQRGRKKDFVDAERLVKRLVARELTLSFVPDVEQRLWRAVTRKKYQLRRDLVRLNNQLESLLEETHIKLSSLVSDLLGVSAKLGPAAATFPSEKCLSSWVGACPGDEESAGVNYSHRSPKGNRHMRRLLNQAANAAVKVKGSIFEVIYRRCVPRLGHNQAIGVIAHRQCRLIWLILHNAALYEERGPRDSICGLRVSYRTAVQKSRDRIVDSQKERLPWNLPFLHYFLL